MHVEDSTVENFRRVSFAHLAPLGAGQLLVGGCQAMSSDDLELFEDGPLPANSLGAMEYTGGSVSYYVVPVDKPTTEGRPPYTAECNDIIEALGMNYAEGNAFKALWRRAAARTLGLRKAGYKDGLYDAEKVEFFGRRLVVQEGGQ